MKAVKLLIVAAGLFILSTQSITSTCRLAAEPATGESTEAAYRKEIDEWHAKRVERLRDEYGWLSLVGLMPLRDGDNRFGSAADNDLVFPEKAPGHAGVLTLENGTVHLKVTALGKIESEGNPVRMMDLASDAEEGTTILDMGDLRFYVIERSGRFFVRLKDKESEARKHFKGIERYPVRGEWRIEGRFEPYDPPKKLRIPNALGMEFEETCPGSVVFEVGGVTQRLEPTADADGGLFFVFADATSGNETYGGGRFLYTDPPGPDGKVILDFNKAYNPPCVFTPFATCPLPHAENILKVKVEAGEKNYAGGGH